MNDRDRNERQFSTRSSVETSTELADRRRSARKPFIAEAVVVEAGSGAKLSGRSCDLVAEGFYMDTLNPLPQGTQVLVRLKHGDSRIEAAGHVVYRVPGLGMGIAFSDLRAEQRAILNRWLSDVEEAGGIFQASLPPISARQPSESVASGTTATRLIAVLRRKGILTEQEASDLLQDPEEREI